MTHEIHDLMEERRLVKIGGNVLEYKKGTS